MAPSEFYVSVAALLTYYDPAEPSQVQVNNAATETQNSDGAIQFRMKNYIEKSGFLNSGDKNIELLSLILQYVYDKLHFFSHFRPLCGGILLNSHPREKKSLDAAHCTYFSPTSYSVQLHTASQASKCSVLHTYILK